MSTTSSQQFLGPSSVKVRKPHRKSSRTSLAGSDYSLASSLHPSSALAKSFRSSPKEASAPAKRWLNWMSRTGMKNLTLPCLLLFVGLIKWVTGIGGWSGKGDSPMFGDFEAQRHWMEITLHLPTNRWYYYDLPYWGLDYPPLTAYHSLVTGWIGSRFSSSWFALDTSRGGETVALGVFMRASVLFGEILVWWTAVYAWFRSAPMSTKREKDLALFTLLLSPALILIDNGHFQYNTIMLGLSLWSLNFFRSERDGFAAVAFVGALCFKQMALYYAPAIGAAMLGRCYQKGGINGLLLFVKYGAVTLASFAVVFAPFLNDISQLQQVIHRVFPFARGLFEDKVANFWCASNVLIKWKSLTIISPSHFPLLALLLTSISLILPSIQIFFNPSPVLLPYAMFLSSMGFFLFSFQVHEKSFLLVLMPLGVMMSQGEEEWGALITNVAVFSMWPLLKRDQLSLQYFVLLFLWNYLFSNTSKVFKGPVSFVKLLTVLSYLSIATLHIAETILSPPNRLPDLFVVLNVLVSAGVFGCGWVWGMLRMMRVMWGLGMTNGSKKKN